MLSMNIAVVKNNVIDFCIIAQYYFIIIFYKLRPRSSFSTSCDSVPKNHFSHGTYEPSDDTGSEMHGSDFDDFGQSTRRLP